MRIKIILLTFLLFSAAFFLPAEAQASEVPSASITLSDEIYADLAIRNNLDHISLYYFDGNTANTVSFNAGRSWDPASTIKLYAAMFAYDQVAIGKISLDQLVTIKDSNVAPSESFSSGYAPLQNGDTVTVYRLLDQMITQSDNTAFNSLLDLLDRREITKYTHDLGLVNSNIGSKLNLDNSQLTAEQALPGYGPNTTNADDYARAFILINGQRLPGSSELFDTLTRQKFNEMIPALLPKNVVVAHKTGELDPYYHDGGIVVDANKKYILSIFSDAGEPALVAHLSDLVYTKDINLIGGDLNLKGASSEAPSQPLDPLVAEGEVQQDVLAASTQNIKTLALTASDLGINPTDLSYILSSSQLPRVVIPADSKFHLLIDWTDKITSLYPTPPLLAVIGETSKLKLKLSEANDLVNRGKVTEANDILRQIDARIGNVAKLPVVAQNSNLQVSVEQVSQTRFAILKKELSSGQADRVAMVKEIANQARGAVANVKPYVKDATAARNLSQEPIVGQVVSSTVSSVTLKTDNGGEVTVPLDLQVKTKAADQTAVQVENATQIPVGTEIALVGASRDGKIKPFFVLTNVVKELKNEKPTTVLKVNLLKNTIVVAGDDGIPVQIDLTKKTVIKGGDTSVSLNEIRQGDMIVVHGIPVPPPAPVSVAASPSATPLVSPSGSPRVGASPLPVGTGATLQTSAPAGSAAQKNVSSPPGAPPAKNPAINKPAKPQVIKGGVIEVISKGSDRKPQPTPKEQPKKVTPNLIPPATPVPEEKKR